MNRFSVKIITIISVLILFSCQNNTPREALEKITIHGKTMGTTYHITYYGKPDSRISLNQKVNQLLVEINAEVSTYIPTSTISLFNKTDSTFCISKFKKHFLKNYIKSLEIAHSTNDSFDPTIMPLVNYWGFGYTAKKPINQIDSLEIVSKLSCVGIDKIKMNTNDKICLSKSKPCTQLDFSALAKGYGVDMVSELLLKEGFKDHLVEIGGEIVAKGIKPQNKEWTTGISNPIEDSSPNSYDYIISLRNKAMATSGNYRNFYKKNGITYSHTINPQTGFPERSNLLSATVIAEDCLSADAYATAYMTMGIEKAIIHVNKDKKIQAFFIFVDQNQKLQSIKSNDFEGLIELNK